MQVLPERPGIAEEGAEIGEVEQPVGTCAVSDRVLHERVGGDDEVAREPRPHEQSHGHREVTEPAESLLAEEEQTEERGLEDEGEHPLDGEGLAHDLAGVPGEAGPVRPELELERDSRHDAHGEIEREDPRPEPRDLVVPLSAVSQREGLEDDDQERQPHRELREQVVVGDRERELDPVPEKAVAHLGPPFVAPKCSRSTRLSILPEPLLDSSVSENSTRRGTL